MTAPFDDVPTLTIADHEARSQKLEPSTVDEALRLFREGGALRLHRAIPLEFLDELDGHYRKRYWSELESTDKEDRRPLFTVDVEGPFARPQFYANPLVFPIIERLLGDDCILGACSSVVSFPGAPDQFTHRDSDSLFGDFAYDVKLPPYALTVLMPLVDADAETGSTEVWPTTQHEPDFEKAKATPPVHPVVPRGSIMMTDSRVVHRGARNRSERVRPLVYCSYHRHWFRDYGGYETRPPISINPIEYVRVPREYRRLFSWGFDRYLKIRVKRGARRVALDVLPQRVLLPLKHALKSR